MFRYRQYVQVASSIDGPTIAIGSFASPRSQRKNCLLKFVNRELIVYTLCGTFDYGF